MEVPRIIHDELLHLVEEPREEHLAQTFRLAQHSVAVAPSSGVKASETTALLPPKVVALVVDMDEVDAILAAEEETAVLADAKLSTLEIVRTEAKALVGISIPMVMTVMLEAVPQMGLSMMIGHTDVGQSTQILAAFGLSNIFQMLLVTGLLFGLGTAIDTLCSQAFGGKRMIELWLFCQAGLLIYLICLPFVTLMLMCGEPILILLGQDLAIAALAGQLLMVNTLSIPFGIAFSVMRSALQAQNIVFPFVVASLVAWSISGLMAYYLAFHTPLSYMGVAIASPLCWLIKSMMLVPVLLRNKVFLESWPGWQIQRAKALVPKIYKLGISSVLMVTFQMMGLNVISLMAGLLPNAGVMIAANGIFAALLGICFMPLLGICVAGAVRIGNALGAGQARRAKLISRLVMAGCVGLGGILTALVPLFAGKFVRSFTPNADAVQVATDLICKFLPVVPFFGIKYGMQSAYCACGKQFFCAMVNFFCLVLLGVPVGIWFAFKLNVGLAGCWIGYSTGLLAMAIVGAVWFWQTSWTQLAHEAKRNTHLHFETPAAAAAS